MVQMVGVLVLALGCRAMFDSIDDGDHVDNGVMVAGYVVMRVAMVAQWAARRAPGPGPPRGACLTYAVTILVAQVGWIVLLVAQTVASAAMFAWAACCSLIELAGPVGRRAPQGRHAVARRTTSPSATACW